MTATALKVPNASWPLASLMRSLARAGWGDLTDQQRGAQVVLRALADVLPDGSGNGKATAPQIADVSGYSKRWVEQQLRQLEDLGLIVWVRGGIVGGRPRPSIFKIVKARLVELIMKARPELAARVQRRREATEARLAKLPRFLRSKPRKPHAQGHNPRSAHAEVEATPSPYREGPGALRAATAVPAVAHNTECEHGEPRGSRYCGLCRHGIPA